MIFTINIEYWEPFRPGQKEPLFPGGPATIPHALPGDVLDTANWTWREYGQRIGIWRVIDVFDKLGVAPSCTCNGMIMVERRRIVDAVKERGWELVPHNWAQNDLLTYYAHNPDQERAVIRKTLDKYQEVVGKPAKAWLSSAIRGTLHTPAFLKEFGLDRLLRLSQRRPALSDRHHSRADRLRALFQRHQRLQHVRARQRVDPRRHRDAQALLRSTSCRRRDDRAHHERRAASACHRPAAPDRGAARVHRIRQRQPKVWFPTREEIATWYLAEQTK